MNVETTTSTSSADVAASATNATNATNAADDLAPPFYQPWAWGRSYPPAGFWSAYRHFDNRGELVLQLGREGGQGRAKATNAYSRYESYSGTKIYVVRFEAISLSRRPNSASKVNLRAFLQIDWWPPKVVELTGGTRHMVIRATGRHVFRVGCQVELQHGGNYGEVICKIADVNQTPFDVFAKASAQSSLDTEPSIEEMQQELERLDGGKVEIVKLGSLKDVVTAGAEVFEGTH